MATYSAHYNFETPTYKDQKAQEDEWMKAHSDIIQEIENTRIAIQRTNLNTLVPIEIGGNTVVKSIAAWIHRRKDLAGLELQAWKNLTDKNLREGIAPNSSGIPQEVKIIRCYEPKVRDDKMSIYSSEPSLIDAKLEIVNAVTDIIAENKS
jgi:hypothetical protein